MRSLVGIPAGVAGMPRPTFLRYTTLGSAAWNVLLVVVGHELGRRWDDVGRCRQQRA